MGRLDSCNDFPLPPGVKSDTESDFEADIISRFSVVELIQNFKRF